MQEQKSGISYYESLKEEELNETARIEAILKVKHINDVSVETIKRDGGMLVSVISCKAEDHLLVRSVLVNQGYTIPGATKIRGDIASFKVH